MEEHEPVPSAPDLSEAERELARADIAWQADWKQRQAVPPPTLYHYTDAVGLKGILENDELWASDAAFLNDSTELVYVRGVLHVVASRLKERYDQRLVHDFLELLDHVVFDIVMKDFDIYVVCFCERGDQLSQWRGYPPAGGGYAIGFDTSVVAAHRMLCRVIYKPAEQEEIVRNLLIGPCDYLVTLREDISSDERVSLLSRAAQDVSPHLAQCSFCFKHPRFDEEREWRLIRASAAGGQPRFEVKPQFRPTRTGLVPYTTLSIARDADSKPPITEVVVGPSAHPMLAARATQQLLKSVGYESASERVSNSRIPLRV